MPKRIQRKREKGWKMPPNTIYVGRPTQWGNPFRVGVHPLGGTVCFIPIYQPNGDAVMKAYREYVERNAVLVEDAKEKLRGKNLACWCKAGAPCHADILLELANQ